MKFQVEKIESYTGHKDSIYCIQRTKDEKKFLSAGGDGLIVEWDSSKTDLGKPLAKVNHSVYAMHYEESNNLLWIGENYEGLQVLDLRERKKVKSIALNKTAIFAIKQYQNDIFVASEDGVISVIDREKMIFKKHLKSSAKSVRSLAINPLKNEFAAAYSDHTIRIFDLSNYDLKKQIHAHRNSVFCLDYSPDFQYLISGSRDAHLKIWSVNDNYDMKEQIIAHMFTINDLSFNPNGQLFASSSMDKTIKIWDAQTFKLLKVIDSVRHEGHSSSVNKIRWLSNNTFVSASDDRSILLWKITRIQS